VRFHFSQISFRVVLQVEKFEIPIDQNSLQTYCHQLFQFIFNFLR